MIKKSELKGKYISYIDNDGKYRVNKVIKITGNSVTVKDALKRRRRIARERILGRQYPSKGLEDIDWSRGV